MAFKKIYLKHLLKEFNNFCLFIILLKRVLINCSCSYWVWKLVWYFLCLRHFNVVINFLLLSFWSSFLFFIILIVIIDSVSFAAVEMSWLNHHPDFYILSFFEVMLWMGQQISMFWMGQQIFITKFNFLLLTFRNRSEWKSDNIKARIVYAKCLILLHNSI